MSLPSPNFIISLGPDCRKIYYQSGTNANLNTRKIDFISKTNPNPNPNPNTNPHPSADKLKQ